MQDETRRNGCHISSVSIGIQYSGTENISWLAEIAHQMQIQGASSAIKDRIQDLCIVLSPAH